MNSKPEISLLYDFYGELLQSSQQKVIELYVNEDLSLAETAELLGLYLFVALPVPGTGVWMGSAIATLFEMPLLKSAVVILLGNMTACLLTTLITTGVIALV